MNLSDQKVKALRRTDSFFGAFIASKQASNFLVALSIIVSLFTYSSTTFANSGITYHGRLLNPNGSSVSSSNVQFRLQIRTPGTQDCLMYEELQSLDLSTTNGMFSISLGDGSGSREDSNSWTLFDALSNRKAFSFNGADCTSGPSNYTPDPSDNRRLRVLFNDGTFSGWETLPIQRINYIPMSIESYAVGGFPASSLLRVENAGNLVNTSPLNNAQYTELLNLLSGSSLQYQRAGQLNGSNLPALTSGQVIASDGSGGWVATSPLTSESDPNVEAFAKSALPTCGVGEVLKSDGTSLSCVSDAGGWSAVDATDSVKGIVMVPASGGLVVSSGSIGLPDQTLTPGTYTKMTVDQKGRVTAVDDIDGDDITSGTIGGTTAVNTSGNIQTSGSISSGSFSTRQLDLYDSDNSNYIRFLTPGAGDLAANYSLVFPATQGLSNQVLGMNSAGSALENKSITAGSGISINHTSGGIEIEATGSGVVASVSGTANQISVDNTDAANPIVSLADLAVSPAGSFGSSTQIPSLTVDAKGRVTAISNNSISIDPEGKPLALNHAWIGDSSGEAEARYFSVADIRRTSDGAAQIPITCTSSQTFAWSAVTDVFSCADISITLSQVSNLSSLSLDGSDVVNTPQGDISSTTAQAAINELDSEKVSKAGDTMSGDLNMNTNKILNVSNIPFTASNPTVGQDGQTLRWNNTSSEWEWFTAGAAGSGISTFNGETGATQSLAIGTAGNLPNWGSNSNIHTLNIPLASTGGTVTAGLISNADYVAFNSKLGAVAGSTLANTNIWVGNGSNQATAVAMSGDATLANDGTLTLKNTGTAATYGSATQVPVFTTDAQGRVTGVTNTTITGTSPVGSSLTSTNIWVGDVSNQAAAVAMSGDATLANDGTLTLKNTGTAGTYTQVTTDAQGRVTSGSSPTSLSGYGITDAVQNAGSTVSLQSGLDASRGAASTDGRVYLATDTQKIYRDNGSSWIEIANVDSGSGGTVTEVTANAPLSVTNGTSTPDISIGDATALAKGVVSVGAGLSVSSGEISLPNTGTAGAYGSASEVPVLVTDAQGRVTGVTDTAIEITMSQVSDLPTLGSMAEEDSGDYVAKAGDTMAGDLNLGSNKILAVSNVPFTAANPTVGEDGQSLRWNNTLGQWEWFTAGAAGAGIGTLNGQSGSAQSFAVGSSGTAPAWNSATDTHTLNIPMASSGGTVTAGLLSNAEYVALNAKLGAVSGSTLQDGYFWLGDGSNEAQAVSMSGDATLANDGALTLADTTVTANTYGSASEVPVLTVDAKGRITGVTNTVITGTSPVGSTLNDTQIWVGDGSNVAQAVSVSGDATIANDGELTLKNTGTAGTYRSVTTDAQGRVTAGTNPTTISGYGITDAITNAGGTVSIESGLTASRPLAGTAGRLYFSTDDQEISRDNGTSWDVIASAGGSGGTVTSVSGTLPVVVADGTTTPTISVNDATDSLKGVVSVDTSSGLGISSGVLSLADLGVDPSGSFGSSTQIPSLTVDAKGRVTAISNNTVSLNPAGKPLALNHVWIGDGDGEAEARYFSISDIRRTSDGAAQIPSSCTASQTMTWSAVTDVFVCSNISVTVSQISDFPTVPDGDDFVEKTGDTMTGTLNLPGNGLVVGTNQMVVSGGNVGIGTNAPTSTLEVSGAARNTASIANATSDIDFSTGNIQYTTSDCGAFNLHNLKDGGSYTFIVQGTTPSTCSFNGYSDGGTTSLTVHLPSGHGATTSGEHTIYTIIVAGTHAYFAWVTEFD